MELYTLKDNFEALDIFDSYKSFIWTERWTTAGDFKLVIPDSTLRRVQLQEGKFVSLPESREVMMIETQEVDAGYINVTGPSLTSFLNQRMVRNTADPAAKYWELTGSPGWIMCEIVRQMCIDGGLIDGSGIIGPGAREVIPELVIGNIASGATVTIAVEYGTVYEQLKKIGETYNVGFSMYPTGIGGGLYNLVFDTYNGTDRTSDQTIVDPVVFEPSSDTLTKVKSLRSIAGYKNVAYVWPPAIDGAPAAVGIAYADADSELAVGFDRRTLMLTATDVNELPAGTTLQAVLDQKAKDALANNNYVKYLDGEIVPSLTFKYDLDYALGDVVELRSNSLVSQKARITEYIRSQDSTGERAYPTLKVIEE